MLNAPGKVKLEVNQGFTLIELVIVIVLIGILSATALPRFANLTTQAQTASNRGVGGGLASATGIAHAAWIAGGAAGAGNVTLDTVVVSVNANGWPDGGGALAPSAAQCVTAFNAILYNPPTAGTAACPAGTTNPCYQVTAPGGVCTYTLANTTLLTTITYNVTSGAVLITP